MADFQNRERDSSTPGLTRRQFLSYALGGTGAFMASIVAAPMVVEAFDPIRRSGGNAYFNTNHKVSEFNKQLPTLVEYLAHRDDGWNSADVQARSWIILQPDGSVLAMSPICTHLGCQVNGTLVNGKPAPSQDGPWWFHCPCHGSKYTKYGVNSPDSPAPRPLDVHKVKVDSSTGDVWLGPLQQRNRSGQVIS